LWDAPNVIITGHTAGGTPMFRQRVLELFAENIRRYQSGEELVNVVDTSRGY
jgi:phosphoglycerate dehydrogenase-like enzyme